MRNMKIQEKQEKIDKIVSKFPHWFRGQIPTGSGFKWGHSKCPHLNPEPVGI